MSMNRVVLHGELTRATKRAQQKIKDANLVANISAVSMSYFPNRSHNELSLESSLDFPSVVKVGNTHAGYGKMRISNKSDSQDLRSILALGNDYYT